MKSYFAAPDFDCSPSGPLGLGSILTNPLDPSEPLNARPIPIPPDAKTITSQANFDTYLQRSAHRSGGLWLTFVQSLVGLELSGRSDETSTAQARFDRLETWSFQPSDEYLKESVAAAEVQAYLAGGSGLRRKRLYMVTGVKVAYGARVAETVRRGKAGKFTAGLDGSAVGAPFVAFGPRAEGSTGFESSTRFGSNGPFIFAYRLREIRYRKGVLTAKPYRDGALYGVGAVEEGEEETKEEGIILLGLDEDDVTGDDIGVEALEVWEDGAEGNEDEDEDEDACELIVPVRGQEMDV